MLRLIKRGIINAIIITILGIIFLHTNGVIGVATSVVEAEDNCKENGYSYFCTTTNKNNVWIDMDKSREGDKFIYLKPTKNNTVVKLFSIN
ncbi:hypothetical protein RSJ2_4173 (plasmid) [Clostridium botulinum]|uniref:hypothetical protein n=1 Tax=Clostridium botulinum TaxID=1491 RepID=UPI000464CEFD|nr:hypothetical protein [Clostridium botulinum]APR02328.1 hypothetical protein RSJ2_4173 [Clostridium botulinum]MBN3352002.1 hypothetical protein [Clostridium botulinum]